MKRLLQGLFLMTLLMMVVTMASATAVIDFGSGVSGAGGTVTLLSGPNLTGTDVPIGVVTISGAPTNNGTFFVFGSCTSAVFASSGCLSFDTRTASNFISIVGTIPSLGITTSTTLLSGTITGFDTTNVAQGLTDAFGPDTKSAALLSALGLPTDTQFGYFGFSLATNTLSTESPTSSAISTDIKNTSVPEPASLTLLGAGLLGLGGLARRKLLH